MARVAVVFLAVALIAFGPALAAPFDFDDLPAIAHNPSIRTLWPPSVPLSTPGLGTAVSGRPTANYSFALSHAVNRWLGVAQSPLTVAPNETIGFHAVNLLLHVAAALLLFSIIRRTMRSGRVPDDWRGAADRLAIAIAGVWLIHPLQTEAVDYVAQRTEVLVSVFYLATLYSAFRAWQGRHSSGDDQRAARQSLAWSAAAVAACLLGMGTKEVMLTAPLMVVLFDRAFLFSSWREMWTTPWRRRLYYALFATCALSILLITRGARSATVGFHLGIPWYQYFHSQGWAIARYLKLALWPDRLTYDYGQTPVRGLDGIPGLVALIAFGVITLLAWRRPRWQWFGFVGAWFFLLLAPSSSVVPIQTEIAAERRIYLALASIVALAVIAIEFARRRLAERDRAGQSPERSRAIAGAFVVIGVSYFAASGWTAERLAPNEIAAQLIVRTTIGLAAILVVWCLVAVRERRLRLAAVALIVCAMAGTAFTRSRLYENPELLWRDAVAKRPDNARALNGLAVAALRNDPTQLSEADSLSVLALAIDSAYIPSLITRGAIAIKQARMHRAESLFTRALRISPNDSASTDKLGQVLVAEGESERAIPYLAQVVRWHASAEALTNLGVAYLTIGKLDSASAVLTGAVRADPTNTDAARYLGAALIEQQRGADAIPYLLDAARRDPQSGFGLGLLSVAYAEAQQPAAATETAAAAVARSPEDATTFVFAGRAAQIAGRYQDAVAYLTRAVTLVPNDLQAFTRLAIARASIGDSNGATLILRRVLAAAPDYGLARHALDSLSRTGRR